MRVVAIAAATGILLSICAVMLTLQHTTTTTTVLSDLDTSPIFTNPDEVSKANTYLAPDQTVRVLYTTIDNTRDLFEQLQGALDARTTDEDCDGIHSIAKEVKDAHSRFLMLELQYKHLKKSDRQAVAAYVQERLISPVHSVTTGVVKALLVCEQSQSLYHQATANIRMTAAKLDVHTKHLEKYDTDCVKMQDIFHDAMNDINNFHTTGEAILTTMRQQNMIVAADQALLETEARIHPAEHDLYTTYAQLWQRSCQQPMYAALGLNTEGEASSAGAAAAAGSGSASGSSGSDSGSADSAGDDSASS